MPYHQLIYDSGYGNEQTIGDYEGILEGFDYISSFLEGKQFSGKIPDDVRLYIREDDENLPQASLLANPLHWLIFSNRLLEFTWPFIKNNVQVFDAPVYFKNRQKAKGYKLINPIRVIDCIDWKKSQVGIKKNGTISCMGDIYIKESRVGDHHLFRLEGWTYSVIVSDQLAKSIARKGFKGISFIRCGVSK